MAWSHLSLTRMLLLGLIAPLSGVCAADKKVETPQKGTKEGLAYEEIQKVQVYTDNSTIPGVSPPTEGWWKSKICSGPYCVYTNRKVAKGRGIALVTKLDEFQKVERIEEHLNHGDNRYEEPVTFTETEVLEKGPGITATKTIRRGKQLMSWSPVLLVHKDFFDDVVKKKERTRLLEAAVGFLPDSTRAAFNKQRLRPGESSPQTNPRSIEEILYAHPFEIDLGAGYRQTHSSKHFINYPEVALFQHDCRPNVAYYIDSNLYHRTTAARKITEGEELSISYIDIFEPGKTRQDWVKRFRGLNKPCPCATCTQKNLKEHEKRMDEILKIRAELRNHDSKKVTVEMIDRFIKLYQEEKLNTKLAEAYELAALNYNYLGEDKKAKKYADLAVQAGIVEGGKDSNDVIAMRVMASDIKGHYSYRFTLKRRGL
ncbi:hypothetical protein QBC38DRAFT_88199 [Podospora fimiseda]|uniref:SET domain-containing protein n=1 Tax=Podospora fimiseda TaxID=252190 RepID=A0AAN6YN06_9PEZI|nr:hypothetical protein QBC38DRAFT_88199 [Podospora fimiseda]